MAINTYVYSPQRQTNERKRNNIQAYGQTDRQPDYELCYTRDKHIPVKAS